MNIFVEPTFLRRGGLMDMKPVKMEPRDYDFPF